MHNPSGKRHHREHFIAASWVKQAASNRQSRKLETVLVFFSWKLKKRKEEQSAKIFARTVMQIEVQLNKWSHFCPDVKVLLRFSVSLSKRIFKFVPFASFHSGFLLLLRKKKIFLKLQWTNSRSKIFISDNHKWRFWRSFSSILWKFYLFWSCIDCFTFFGKSLNGSNSNFSEVYFFVNSVVGRRSGF